jgi:hypothetical protein
MKQTTQTATTANEINHSIGSDFGMSDALDAEYLEAPAETPAPFSPGGLSIQLERHEVENPLTGVKRTRAYFTVRADGEADTLGMWSSRQLENAIRFARFEARKRPGCKVVLIPGRLDDLEISTPDGLPQEVPLYTLQEVYDELPLTERALLRRYKSYPFKIANDRGGPCEWWLYESGEPVGVVIYYKGRKLTCHGYGGKE